MGGTLRMSNFKVLSIFLVLDPNIVTKIAVRCVHGEIYFTKLKV
jgi:hypothetical protein